MAGIRRASVPVYAIVAALIVAVVAIAVFVPSTSQSPVDAASTVVAVREVKVSGFPENANGQELQLVRYDIPAGVVLAVHTHPGMQIAWIESGVLNYNVLEGGEIPINRSGSDEPEMIGPGETTDLRPGDSVVEVDGVVHYGQNLGVEPVILWAATLLDPNQPPAVAVTPAASPAASPAGA